MPQSSFLLPSPTLRLHGDHDQDSVMFTVEPQDSNSGCQTIESLSGLSHGIRSHKVPGTRCPTCALAGKEVWVIPGRCCGYCGTPCVD
ncbi:hypothetical protein DER45DRAFT_567513 [Fusarium avenaceum]|nr:hypothetical protein DER45DRAFT_567513 [Fusarium avenaceum]